MKKLATLLLAAGLVFSASTGAQAIDFKAKGQWIVNFDYGENGNFMGKYDGHTKTGSHYGSEDDFEANQRFRVQFDAVASESLSGTLWFEIGGNQFWGKYDQGGALGADQTIVKVKGAWIDWMIPETDAKVRMGIQHVTLPSFTVGGSTVMDDDVAGITASMQVNENVGVTAIWMRPFNDNFTGWGNYNKNLNQTNFMDNMDLVSLLVPLTFDGAKVTPWGMYGGIGPNTFRAIKSSDYKDSEKLGENQKLSPNGKTVYTNDALGWYGGSPSGLIRGGLFPIGGARHRDFSNANGVASRKLTTYANAWWGGITGEVTMWDPFRLAWDFAYGSVTWDDDGRLNRQGWMASLLLEYKLDWAIPGLYGWYASGDDSNPANGSERMPTISENNTNKFSDFAFTGAGGIARRGVIDKGGMGGTWGIGARLKDMSFLEDIKTTFRVNLIGGTNSPTMAKKMSLNGLWANGETIGDFEGSDWGNNYGMYLTTQDYALEFGLSNAYKMYENLTVNLSANYIAMWLDTSSSVWGARHKKGLSIPQTKDAWDINCNFVYSF